MKKRWWIIGGVVVCAGLVSLHLWHKKNNVTPTPTVKVTQGNITEKAEAVGYIKPRHSITIKSQIDGKVAAIYRDEGDAVKKHEPLIKIRPTPKPADYATTYQTLQTAVAKAKLAKQSYDRYHSALRSGLITRNYTDYIVSKQNYQTTQLDRQLAAQKLALLEKGKIKVGGKAIENVVASPIDGYILTRSVDVGDAVISLSSAQSATALFTVANMHDLMFEGTVDEMDASKIHVGMPAKIVVGAVPKKEISGKLTEVSLQSAVSDTNSPFNVGFDIKITDLHIPKGLRLRSGYSATASVNLETVKNVLLLPERVIRFEDDKFFVLLPPKVSTAEPEKKHVKLGLSDGINVEILSGVKKGETVLDASALDDNDNDSGN